MGATHGSASFGVLLLQYRLAAGLSQEELAERAGLSRRGISDLERGARRAPYPATVRRLIEALALDSAERAALLSSAHTASGTQRALEDRPHAAPSTRPLTAELPDTEIPNLADLVRRYRLNARLTQDGLARKAGLSVRAISDLERGIRRFPHPDTLQRLGDALELADSDRALLEAAAVRLGLPGQRHFVGTGDDARQTAALPSGTLTFLFTDVEASTRAWLRNRQAMSTALARHDEIIERLVARHGGRVVRPRGEGDSRFAVFARASDAVGAACAVQLALYEEHWTLNEPLRVRIAVHTGEAGLHEGDYYGPAVNHCARLRAIAHGGQVVVSAVTADLVREELSHELTLRDLGHHQLKDLEQPERVWQLLHPRLPSDFPPLLSMRSSRHNLPPQLTSFVGRVQELEGVRRELARTRLLSLTGPGGVGKTRLAIRVAAEELDAFRDGVWFVELAPLTEASLVPQSIATVFDVREKPEESLIASLAAALQPLHVLLILDNCEHLLERCADLVQRLLRACPKLVVLATSREVLGLGAESVWRVPPLGFSSPESEAAELFVDRARAVQPGFALSPQTAPAVLELCRQLDGIPLAIELAASRVGAFGLEQLIERLATDTRFLLSKDRTAVRRQQTLENTIQWSYDLLTPEEQALFDRLSVFAGGWTLAAMEAVAASDGGGHELLDVLERLIDKSLVQVDDAPGRPRRYRLLEPLRQFARDRLEERGEVAATHARHAAFVLELFEAAEQEFLKQHATPSLVSRMDGELGNLRVALRWLIGEADAERAQRLAGSSRTLWLERAYLAEGRRWLEEALALDSAVAPPKDPAAQARALYGLLGVAVHQGDLAVAEEAGLRSLHLFEELGDTGRAAGAFGFLGQVAAARADLARARHMREQAVGACRETGSFAGLALMLSNLAEFDLEEGDLVAAQRHAEESLKVATAAGHAAIGCRAMVNLGEVQRRLGRRDAAQRIWEEALKRVGEAYRQYVILSPTLITLGRQASESEKARACLVEGLQLARQGNRWDLARGLEVVVELAAAEGQVELTLRLAGAAAALRDRMGTLPWPSERARLDAATSRARQGLTEDAADLAWMQGWTSPVDGAVAMALDFLQQSSLTRAEVADDHPSMFFSAASSGP